MKQVLLPTFLLFFLANAGFGQTSKSITVPLKATVTQSPAAVQLSWPNPDSSNLLILKRTKGQAGNQWIGLLDEDNSMLTELTDNNVQSGQIYEYVIQQEINGLFAYGYVHVGVYAPAVDERGSVLLFVDSTLYDPLGAELERLRLDLIGDGWHIQEIPTPPSATVTWVKDQIVQAYSQDDQNVRSVFLLGAIPIPYSGNANWDGHPEHAGAWPADSYYADVDGVWTDVSINNLSPARAANDNVPDDGKFDQSFMPSNAELEVGRVDFKRLNPNTFGASTVELLRRYLDKDHAWRNKQYVAENKALVDDNFGYFSGEAFGANGWRNAYPLVGDTGVVAADFFNDTDGTPWLMAYGCGGGSYTSANGVGNSNNFANDSVNAVFTMLFGSYHGDWDFENNPFMVSALASKGGILTCSWAGRPHWFYHPLASGETVGYCTRETQNASTNNGFYSDYFGRSGAHVALLGDPTLRAHVVAPPEDLAFAKTGCRVIELSWAAADQNDLEGYYVYRATDRNGPYTRLNDQPVTNLTFQDIAPDSGRYWYQVRSVYLESSFGGGFYVNTSTGKIIEVDLSDAVGPELNIPAQPVITCRDSSVTIEISSPSDPNVTYQWTGPNGFTSSLQNPIVDQPGVYTPVATGANGCTRTETVLVEQDTSTPVFSLQDVSNTLTCSNPVIDCSWEVPNLSGVEWMVNFMAVSPGQTVNLCPIPGTPGYQSLVTAMYTDNGCSSSDTFFVEQDTVEPDIDIEQTDSITCDGIFKVYTINSFTSDVVYEWTGPGGFVSNQPSLFGNNPGTFTGTVLNPENGCTSTMTVEVGTIVQYPAIGSDIQATNESAPGASDGAVDITPSGGFPPYTFEWNNGATTEDIANLPGGLYQVTITDSNGCTYISPNIMVGTIVNTSALPEGVNRLDISPNPTSGYIRVDVELVRPLPFSLELWSPTGQLLYSKKMNPVTTLREHLDLSQWPAGMYHLHVVLPEGATAIRQVVKQ